MLSEKDTIRLDNVSVYFWKIEECRKDLEILCDNVDITTTHITEIKSDRRACEKLATHLIIAHILGNKAELCHTDEGAPFIKNSHINISISHSAHIVAVAFSSAPVGIDIEHKADKVLRVREKFLNSRELSIIDSNDKIVNMMFWTAKEAVYKIHGKKGINFSNDIYQDIHIKSIYLATDGRKKVRYQVQHYTLDKDFIIAIATPECVKSQKIKII